MERSCEKTINVFNTSRPAGVLASVLASALNVCRGPAGVNEQA